METKESEKPWLKNIRYRCTMLDELLNLNSTEMLQAKRLIKPLNKEWGEKIRLEKWM